MMIQKTLYFLIPFLYGLTIFTVVATAQLTGYSDFLKIMTQENGVFEILSVLWLFTIFSYGTTSLILYKKSLNKHVVILIAITSFLALLAVMEEISWGQHIFHFQSNDYFTQHNIQKETNLHNFIDANLFSSLVYVSIYILFVFIPLVTKIFFKNTTYLKYFDINMHYILIILFSSTLQIYFYNNFGVFMDMAAHLFALAFFAYVLWRNKNSFSVKLHYLFILFTTILFMLYSDVFGFFNMQYEIREMFVTLAVLFMFIAFIQKEKIDNSPI